MNRRALLAVPLVLLLACGGLTDAAEPCEGVPPIEALDAGEEEEEPREDAGPPPEHEEYVDYSERHPDNEDFPSLPDASTDGG